ALDDLVCFLCLSGSRELHSKAPRMPPPADPVSIDMDLGMGVPLRPQPPFATPRRQHKRWRLSVLQTDAASGAVPPAQAAFAAAAMAAALKVLARRLPPLARCCRALRLACRLEPNPENPVARELHLADSVASIFNGAPIAALRQEGVQEW
ncbi:MAG: hypothetical protein VXW17_00285, partial [Pseudomonadota bacterium]|nr:hypothetical protein [Pseudomonadota bacterium]